MLTPIEEALGIVLDRLPASRPVDVPLADALGAYLSEDVVADREMPPSDRSAMDGFAVRASDLASPPVELPVAGEVVAGAEASVQVRAGTCVRIFTGAVIPPGADAVAIVETTREGKDGRIRFLEPVQAGQNIRVLGEDAREGQKLLDRGTRLGPAQIAACAAVGADPVGVHEIPRVWVLSTGTELRPAHEDVQAHQIRDSNGPAVTAALHSLGVRSVSFTGGVPDTMEGTCRALRGALSDCDCAILTGGVSKGDYDLVPAAVKETGGTIHLHRVRMKPGKPFLFATSAAGQPIFGLPGNPLSVLVSFWEFVAPSLRAMMGDARPELAVVRARLTRDVRVTGERVLLAPVVLHTEPGQEGILADPVDNVSSADLASGGRANGSVRLVPENRIYRAGTLVDAHLWSLPW